MLVDWLIFQLVIQNPSLKDVNGIFHIEGDELVCDDWKSAFLPFGSKTSNLRVKLTDNLKVEITDNNQVLPTTKFVY